MQSDFIFNVIKLSFFTKLFIVCDSILLFTTVPSSSLNVDLAIIGMLNFFPISTHLLCNTLAPSFDISSISSYDISFNFLAFATFLGSDVNTPSTSE